MQTQLNPYLNFNGQCREAMEFYQRCFGGELTLQKISESPMAAQMPSEEGPKILHGYLTNRNIHIYGSDMIGSGLNRGNGVTLLLNCQTGTEINTYFANLAQGGQIKMPLHQSFWGATYGELTDKFGIMWMFNYSKI